MCLVFGSIVAMPAASFAAENSDIKVTAELSSENDGQATVGDTLTFKGTWDATDANPQPGDQFTVTLPAELGFKGNVPFDLRGSDGTTVWGSCQTNSPSDGIMTCALSDEVTGKEEVKGTFELEVTANAATTEETVTFNLNGKDISVDLPGEGGIDDGVPVTDKLTKTGAMNSNKWSMGWTINLPGSRLAGRDIVNVMEDLSANHKLCDPGGLKILAVRGDIETDVSEIGKTSADVTSPYDFKFVLTQPEGGWDSKTTYRITYNTCTVSGEIDDKGTEYTNEANVDVLGESSGIIGVTQDWNFEGSVKKSGSVLGGINRNGVIQWTVDVSGDKLFGKDSFTFTDTLSGDHALCKDGSGAYVVKGLKIDERYGPTGQRIQTLTPDKLTPTVTSAAEGKSFSAQFDIADTDFAFKGKNYVYRISYQTCATTDGVPAGGTAFTNEASVDGTVDGSTAKVPGRTDTKTGAINTTAVTLDGVEYLPQTTMNWKITVPGEKLTHPDQIHSALQVTDKLSSTQTVCGTGDNVKGRLGLKVQAVDQINNGGLATIDLTESTTAAADGNDLTFNIEEPTLELPDGSTAEGWSKEYQYVISYTTCTASGGMDASGTTYGNEATVAGKTYKQTVTQSNKGSGTGQGVSRGSVEISKVITDNDAAQFVPTGTEFSVHVEEIDPNGVVQNEYDLAVPLNGDPVQGLNARGTGWTIKLSEAEFPSVAGVTFGDPKFEESNGVTPSEDGTTAIATLTPGSNIAVSLTNTAELGKVTIEKKIEGPAADQSDVDSFPITAKIDTSALGDDFPVQADRTFDLTPGEPVTLDNLPIGAVVAFSETLPPTTDLITWGDVVISLEKVEITTDNVESPALVTVTNTANRTVGTFSLSKNVTGDQADNPAVPETVTVTATWEQDGEKHSKELALPTDGTSVEFGEELYIGTKVTLAETPLADGSSIAWGTPTWSGTGVELGEDGTAVVTVTRDAEAAVSVENHAATSTAGISVLKAVGGEAAEAVDPDTQFTVLAQWTDADGKDQSKELTINATEPTSLGEDLPAGTVVTLSELKAPEVEGVNWGDVRFGGTDVTDASDGTATVVVSDQQNDVTLVTVTNEATWKPGTFELSKNITGIDTDRADVPDSVNVTATWILDGEEQSKVLTVPTDGTAVAFGEELPYQTEVILTEETPESSDAFTWATPVWDGDATVDNGDGSAALTTGAGTTASINLANEAEASLGTVNLTKTLSGDGAEAVSADTKFPVTATWTDILGEEQTREIEVTAGKPVAIEDLPLGTKVIFTEGVVPVPAGVAWNGATWNADSGSITVAADGYKSSVSVTAESNVAANHTVDAEGNKAIAIVTGDPGVTAELTLDNAYSETPNESVTTSVVTDSPSKNPGNLPNTGAQGTLLLIVGGLVLVVAGTAAVLAARRRQAAQG